MALDRRRRPFERDRLDDVRIERALGEKAHVGQGLGFLFEHLDEGGADDAALALGILDAGQALQEVLAGVHGANAEAERFAEHLHDPSRLVAAQHPVVDEEAGELIADGAVHEGRRHGRVDPAAQPADHTGAAHLGADTRRRLLDEVLHRPVGARAADAQDEVLQQLAPARRVDDLGMELNGVAAAGAIGTRRHRRVVAVRQDRPALR
jgi:hypothetical protein